VYLFSEFFFSWVFSIKNQNSRLNFCELEVLKHRVSNTLSRCMIRISLHKYFKKYRPFDQKLTRKCVYYLPRKIRIHPGMEDILLKFLWDFLACKNPPGMQNTFKNQKKIKFYILNARTIKYESYEHFASFSKIISAPRAHNQCLMCDFLPR
jgi:hypothetical protein